MKCLWFSMTLDLFFEILPTSLKSRVKSAFLIEFRKWFGCSLVLLYSTVIGWKTHATISTKKQQHLAFPHSYWCTVFCILLWSMFKGITLVLVLNTQLNYCNCLFALMYSQDSHSFHPARAGRFNGCSSRRPGYQDQIYSVPVHCGCSSTDSHDLSLVHSPSR